jgi:hypothetical protein
MSSQSLFQELCVDVRVDTTIPAGAQTLRKLGPGRVVLSGEIDFLTLGDVTDFTVRHELGHTFGLCHDNGPGLMSGLVAKSPTSPRLFSLAERDTIALMLKVAPNTDPPGFTGFSTAASTAFSTFSSQSITTEVVRD